MTMRSVMAMLLHAGAPSATILIRLMVGLVFLSEGIQKFLYPVARGPVSGPSTRYSVGGRDQRGER